MDINKEEILRGTPHKILMRKYQELKENFSRVEALEYFLIYENQPLSFILSHSRYIFSEPIRGTDFYCKLIENNDIAFDFIDGELRKLSKYYEEFKNKMNIRQKDDIEKVLKVLQEKYNNFSNSIALYKSILAQPIDLDGDNENDVFDLENHENIIELYDAKYEIKRGCDNVEEHRNKIIEIVQNSYSMSLFMDAINVMVDLKDCDECLHNYIFNKYNPDSSSEDEYKLIVSTMNILRRMMQDKGIREKVETTPNTKIREIIFKIIKGAEFEDIMKDITTRKAEETDKSYFSGTKNSVNSIYNDDIFTKIYEEDNLETKRKTLEKQKEAVDTEAQFALFDMLMATDKEVEDAYVNALSDLYTTEGVTHVTPDERFSYLIQESARLSDEILVLEFTEGGKQPKIVSRDMENHNEQEKEKKDKKQKIEKPKQKLTSKMQAKALDADKKMKEKTASGNRAIQEVKNTVKAVAKIPENIVNNIKRHIKQWDDMDDNRRKEYIIQAGFRKKYFKLFKLALAHRILFAVNPLFNIVLFIFQKLSHEKDVRIRNELGSEIATEIKICEEKINDANERGDKKEKYQLIRIKEKLQAEEVRIKTNTRYL